MAAVARRREGFLQYCLHAPEGQELLQRFIAAAIKPLADHPALQSICLSNEPVNEEEPCEEARKLWHGWLQKRHGSVAAMNARWGSRFASFGEAPLPDPFAEHPAKPVWMDYIRFNQEFFADWHKMLAEAVHKVAPGLPVHAKAMTWTMFNAKAVHLGVDATLFGRLSDISGNDSASFYASDEGEIAQDWLQNALGYTLQRSVLDAPVFNTENHVIVDRETRYIPANQVRSSLWQGAVYGQSATTIWVWERTFDRRSDFWGSIMHRPACAEAVGRVNCDLNRAAWKSRPCSKRHRSTGRAKCHGVGVGRGRLRRLPAEVVHGPFLHRPEAGLRHRAAIGGGRGADGSRGLPSRHQPFLRRRAPDAAPLQGPAGLRRQRRVPEP